MYEKIIDIIVIVLSELKNQKSFNDINVSELEDKGFTSAEISTAFSWLVDKIEFRELFTFDSVFQSNTSFRMLHEAEKSLFTTEALGELIQYQSLGLLNNDHIEKLIEKSILNGFTQIDSKFLKTFIASIIYNVRSLNMPGRRIMLTGNETIN